MKESIDGEAETELRSREAIGKRGKKKTQLSSLPLLWDSLYDRGFPEVRRAKDAH